MARVRAFALLAAIYFLAAKLGLRLALVHPYASAVWPPSGIAVAALLVWGPSLWPGVYLGALLANLTVGPQVNLGEVLVAAAIALGNTLEALIGASLINRFAGGPSVFDRAAGVFRFSALAAGAGPAVSAAVGLFSLTIAGLTAVRTAPVIALTWWVGDATGVLLFAPIIILWKTRDPLRWSRARAVEAGAAGVAALLLAIVAFMPVIAPHRPGLELAFLCMPALLWPAFRLGSLETAATILVVDAVAVWAWARGATSGGNPVSGDALLALQAYIGITVITLLAIAAERAYAARRQHELRLLTDNAPVFLARCSLDGRYRFANSGYAAQFGLQPEQIVGLQISTLLPPEEYERFRNPISAALCGEQVTFEIESVREPPGRRVTRYSLVPERGPDGTVTGFVSAGVDITADLQSLRESEDKFRQIVETASEGIWIVDPAGVTTFVNGRMCEIIGYERSELVGRCCFDIIHPEDRPRGLNSFESRKRGDRRAREYRVFRKNGDMIWLHFSGAPLRDSGGTLTGILGMCTDITERKLNEARYQTLFATSQDGVLIVNDGGTYVDVNPSYCAMLKATREQLVGSPFAKHIPPDRLGDAEIAFRTLMATGRYEGEFPLLATDGSILELEWRSVGNFLPGLHCCIARDMTDRRRLEQQMQQTQKLESLGVMAGGIAHDFNNLLVGILGNSSLALESSQDPSIQPMLADIVKAGESAARLVRQMLAYGGRGSVRSAPMDVAALIRETAGLVKASIPKTVALHLELQDNLPRVEADAAQLQQVIMNMVINAAEAIPEGFPGLVTVAVLARRLNSADQAHSITPLELTGSEYVEIRFTDTGTGISPEIRRKIFDPFFTTKFAGRGLGLSAVLGIVRSHGGTVTLESEPGHGTTFRVLLPASKARLPERDLDARPQLVTGAGSILVVDDEETVRAFARRALECSGYTVWTAEGGREAIEILENPGISAIILDLAMPVMPGDQVAPLLRARRPEVPIILSSGYSESEASRRFVAGDIVAFLQKPYSAQYLAEKVRTVLRNGASAALGAGPNA